MILTENDVNPPINIDPMEKKKRIYRSPLVPLLRLPLGRLEGYMNSETRRLSWKINVSITTRLQYDIINGDKYIHTRMDT